MSELDLLPFKDGGRIAPLGTMRWLTEAAERVSPDMPLTDSQREHFLRLVVVRMRDQTGATGAAIALEQFGQIVCRASSGETAPDVGTPLRLEGSFTARCIQSGAALRCDDSETDPRVNAEACRTLGTRSMLVVPVRAGDQVCGVVEVLSDQPRAFTNTHQSTLEALADVISSTFYRAVEEPALGEDESPVQAEPSAVVATAEPSVAAAYDDGTWGESPEIEDAAEAEHPTMFRGLRIRQPEAQRTAMVIIAAMLVVAAIGTTLLSRSSRRQHDVVKASTAPVPTASAADIQNAVQEASAHAAAPQTTAAQTVTPPPKKKSAPLEDEVVTRVRTKPVPAAVLSNAVAPDENSAPQAQRAQIIGEPLFRVNPEYPKEAIARHLEGNVVLSAILDKQGRVQTVSVISGDPIFRAAAINAVKQWKYAPTVINGEAMEAETQVTVAFVLER